jgi:hypothetical protein
MCFEKWKGAHCNVCAESWFGKACDEYSALSESCNSHGRRLATGACDCAMNWAGETCDRCASGFFGPSCAVYCDAGRTCDGRGLCDGTTGKCMGDVVRGEMHANNASFTLTRSGWYSAHITWKSQGTITHISGSPFAVHVKPALVSASSSFLTGEQTVRYDELATWQFQARDVFGNNVPQTSRIQAARALSLWVESVQHNISVHLHVFLDADGSARVFSSLVLAPGAYYVRGTLGRYEQLPAFDFVVAPPAPVSVAEAHVRLDMGGSALLLRLARPMTKTLPSCTDLIDQKVVDSMLGGQACQLVMLSATRAMLFLGAGSFLSPGMYASVLLSYAKNVVVHVCTRAFCSLFWLFTPMPSSLLIYLHI